MDQIAVFCANYLYLILLLLAAVWLFFQPRQAKLDMVCWGLFALPAMYVMLLIAGMVYDDPRPFVTGHFTPLIPHAADNGFPSDHTLLCSATSIIVLLFSRRMGTVLWCLTLAVGLSRVYVGVHHLTDILGSIAIAIAVGSLVWIFLVPRLRHTEVYEQASAKLLASST